ncbi:MAG: WD40 repeat domain-containing protein [Planctomycetes bacterium]|nr:WD40 repeat domain-containing protein [Planctomycetota bacterium]
MTPAVALGALAALVAPQSQDLAHAAYRAQMSAAESAVRLGELADARAWLDEVEASQRGIEWRWHDAALDDSLMSAPVAGGALSIAASPRADLLACGRNDGTLELRDATSLATMAEVKAHAQAITQLRFDRGGSRLVTTSYDRKVKVWSVPALEPLFEFGGHGFPVGGADFTPDGTMIVSCAYERLPGTVVGTVHVWNAADGAIARTLTGGRKPLVSLSISPDGAQRIWRVADASLVATLRGHTDAVSKLAFAPDGRTLATAGADGTLRLWDTTTWNARATLVGHRDDVVDLAFTSDGARLVSTSSDGTLRSWDPASGDYGGVRMRATQAAYTVRFSPDGKRLATCSFDGRVQVFCAITAELLGSFQAHDPKSSCHMLAWSPDGRRLVTGSYDKTARVFDAVTFEECARFDHDAGLYWLAMSGDGERIATCAGKSVSVWDVASGAREHVFTGHAAPVRSVAFAPDARTCVSVSGDGKAFTWDAADGRVIATIDGLASDVVDAVFLPGGFEVALAGVDGAIAVFDATSGKRVRDLARLRHAPTRVCLSPDGTRLAVAADTVTMIDVARGGIVGCLRPHQERPYHVAFSPDGLQLASCSSDHTIAIADALPLRGRLTRASDWRTRRGAHERVVADALAAGRAPADIADEIAGDEELDVDSRALRLEALTLAVTARR